VTKTTFSPIRITQCVTFHSTRKNHRRDHQLSDPISSPDTDGRLAQVDGDYTDFAPIIGIDGTWRVNQAEPFTQGPSGTRPNLALVTGRDLNCKTGWDQTACAGF
jgi:hypothetical protein